MIPQLRFPEFEGDWKISRFEEIVNHYKLGGNYTNSLQPTIYPLIKMGNIGRGSMKVTKIEYIPETEKIDPEDKIEIGDLFFNTRNTLELVGKVAIWKNELPQAYFNSNLMRLSFDDNYFMNYRLNSFNGIKGLRRLATGTTSVAAIYTRDLLKLKLTTPSFTEQTKIATFLTAVDNRISLLQEKKTGLKQYKKGVMQRLFNGKVIMENGELEFTPPTLRFRDDNGNDFPDWEEKKLGEVASIYQPKTISQNQLVDEGYDVYGANGIIGKYSKYNHETEQIAVTCRGSTCGTVNYTKPFSWITGNAMVINLDNNPYVLKNYMYYLLTNSRLNYLITGSGQPQITGEIKNHKLCLPSAFEQQKIADFLSSIDKSIDKLSSQIDESLQFKKGLLQKMFV